MALHTSLLSRRALVRLGLGGGGWALLAACQGAPATPQTIEREKIVDRVVTQVVEKPVERVVTQVVVVTATPAAAAPAGAKVVELKLSTDWNTPDRKPVLDLMKKQYEEANPNVKIEHWHMGSGGTSGPGGYSDIVVAQLVTGTAADIVANLFWGYYANYFVDITKDAPAAGWKKDEQLHEPASNSVDGKTYQLPMSASLGGWAYNKSMFQEAGVKEPTDAWTTNDVLQAATQLTRPEKKQYGVWALNRHNNWGFFELMWQAGAALRNPRMGEYFSREKKKSGVLEAGGPDAFEWYMDLMHKHKVAPTPGELASLAGATFADGFVAGKIAMRPAFVYAHGSLQAQIGDRFTWSLMPIPRNPTTNMRATWHAQDGFVFPTSGQKKGTYDAALKYALSFYSDPIQREVARVRGTLPTVKKWITSPEYLSAPPLNLDVITKTLDDPTVIRGAKDEEYHKSFGPWLAAFRREIDRAFVGDAKPKDALAAAVKAGDEILAKD
jgi:ABC-type glycerol-3-phosphate transport system substrate-binding protein